MAYPGHVVVTKEVTRQCATAMALVWLACRTWTCSKAASRGQGTFLSVFLCVCLSCLSESPGYLFLLNNELSFSFSILQLDFYLGPML